MKRTLGAKTLLYPTPVLIVGTYDQAGRPNMMACSWGGICCSTPPCIAVSLRKATFSYGSIVARKAFTVSIPAESQVKAADYIGLVSGREENKFDATGLTPVRSDLVDAPYVAEFPLVLECTLLHTLEIGLHTQFIGEVRDVKADEAVLDGEGTPDIEKLRPILFAPGTRSYHAVGAFLGTAFSVGRKS
jgi:flavin reductase (DIM6/NTAB) family NADH-FMN oxidoreductase RutF